MRALLIALSAAVAATMLVGCSPKMSGVVGVGVDSQGEPVLVMASCQGPADRIKITSVAPGVARPEVEDWRTEWTLRNPEPDYADPAVVSLVDPDPRWEDDDGAPVDFEDDRIYRVWAWPEGDGTLGSVSFELEDLAGLASGEVLTGRRITSAAELIDRAHERCD